MVRFFPSLVFAPALAALGATGAFAQTNAPDGNVAPDALGALVGVEDLESLPALKPKEIAAKVIPSVVTLKCDDKSQGSGFFVGEGIVATNVHVVAGHCANVSVKFSGDSATFASDGVVAYSEADDLALIRVPSKRAGGTPLTLAATAPGVGEQVYAVGSPLGLEATFSDGMISSIRGDDREILQLNAAISPGSSGGPLVNENAKVVGVIVAKAINGEGLNFAISAKRLRPLLDKRVEEAIPFAKLPARLSDKTLFGKVRPAEDAVETYLNEMLVLDQVKVFNPNGVLVSDRTTVSLGQDKRTLTTEEFFERTNETELAEASYAAQSEAQNELMWWGVGTAVMGVVGALMTAGGFAFLIPLGDSSSSFDPLLMVSGTVVVSSLGMTMASLGVAIAPGLFVAAAAMPVNIDPPELRRSVRQHNQRLKKKLNLEGVDLPSGLPQ